MSLSCSQVRMDVKETAEKRRDLENLRRKRKGEKKRILSSPYLFPFLCFFIPTVYHALRLFTFSSRFTWSAKAAEKKVERSWRVEFFFEDFVPPPPFQFVAEALHKFHMIDPQKKKMIQQMQCYLVVELHVEHSVFSCMQVSISECRTWMWNLDLESETLNF
jgi:hypothetical protein